MYRTIDGIKCYWVATVIRLFYSDYLQNHLWGFADNFPYQLPCFQNNYRRNHFRINYSYLFTLLISVNLSKEEIVLLKTPSYKTNWPRKLFQRTKQRYTWEKSLFLFTYTLYETVFLITYLFPFTCEFRKHFLLKQIHGTLRYTFELSHILLYTLYETIFFTTYSLWYISECENSFYSFFYSSHIPIVSDSQRLQVR